MPRSSYGSGTIFKRGDIWYVSYWVNGRQVQKSSRSTNIHDAKRLRDQILGKKSRGEMINAAADRITCGELLDDLLEHSKTNVKESTAKIWKWCIEANIRPFFGNFKVSRLTTETMREYRRKRVEEGRSETTCNRELSILRIALISWPQVHTAESKRTPLLPDGQRAKHAARVLNR
jgi:hypothetical protein